jgi:hypothetical protein
MKSSQRDAVASSVCCGDWELLARSHQSPNLHSSGSFVLSVTVSLFVVYITFKFITALMEDQTFVFVCLNFYINSAPL